MGRWTHFEEDSYRLPEGMTRIGYDADTMVYTFRDQNNVLYQGAPGESYGVLTPVSVTGSPRANAFDSGEPRKGPLSSEGGSSATFHDILPAGLITTPSSSVDGQALRSPNGDRPAPRLQLVNAVRRATLPKMQGVVHNLRRSMGSTPNQRLWDDQVVDDDAPLLHNSSILSRNISTTTTTSSVTSVETLTPKSVNE